MEKKRDLIRQIRAMEKVPVDKTKPFDPSEPPNQGYMEEMSLAELRERLEMVKSIRSQELEDKRERQLEKKHEKQMELAEKLDNLVRVRKTAKEQATARHEEIERKKKEEEERQEKFREQCILEAAEKIAQKKKQRREEEMRLKKELKEISIKRQFLQANAEMVESKAHGEQQLGLQREARNRQNALLIQQKKKNEIKNKETQIRRENRQRDADDFKAMQDAVTARLQKAKEEDQQLKQDIRRANSQARSHQASVERRLAADVGWSSNKYSTHARSSSAHGRMGSTQESRMAQSH